MLLTPMPAGICTLPLRSLVETGVELAGSSDYPVTPPDVLPAIQTAATRRTSGGRVLDGEESLDVGMTLRAYTVGSALALGVEDVAGSIRPGMQADLVHLERDPLAIDVSEVGGIEVNATWVAGRCVHRRGTTAGRV